MFKSNLIGKTVKIVAIGTICLSLAIPSVVNAAHDVSQPENRITLNNFDGIADDTLSNFAEVWYKDTSAAEVSLIDENGNKKIGLNFPGGKEREESQLIIKMNADGAFNLRNDFMPYLVFNMKITDIDWGGIKVAVNYKDENGNGKDIYVAENTLLQRSKDFSDQNNAIEEMRFNQWSAYEAGSYGNGWKDGEEYEYRLNLKEAFPNDYEQMSQCWSIKIMAWRNKQDKDMKMIFDNFRLESGNDKYAYQTFDGISNADDVAWYHNDFSASIENLGYLNSPALKLTGKGNANTQIVFDRGHTVNLLANGNYLYWYMDVDYDATNLQYKPQFINMGMKIITENWTGDEGLIYQDTAITYSESLSGVINGAGYALPDWNANEWNVRIPVGKHWFCMDLTKVFKSDYSVEDIKTSLKQAKSLYLQYNSDQENAGGWNWQSFADVEATFIIDSISSFVKEITDGDANCDGTVDILDLIRVKKYAAGIQTEICAAADLDGNSEINAADSILLRKKLLEK